MKTPNFRLYGTQAVTALAMGLAGVLSLLALAFCVFKGLQKTNVYYVIPYDAGGGLGQYRKMLVFLLTATSVLAGISSGALGYNSLGQKRNDRQGFSWLGLILGAVVLAAAPVLCYAWMVLSEPAILKR